MEKNKDIKRQNKKFLCKKKKNSKKLIENNKIKNTKVKSFLIFENSTDLSSNNNITLEEKSEQNCNIPSLDDIKIPSFFNDITKYDDINRRIKKHHEIKKAIGSPELAEIYLIDIKQLYKEKKKI